MSKLSFQDILNGPAYVINLDRRPDRWQSTTEQLQSAGFNTINRWPAFDGSKDNSRDAFHQLGIDKLSNQRDFLSLKGAQGCAISQLMLLRHIIDSGHPFASIFEDDIRFSSLWNQLAPGFIRATPEAYDLLYLGSQIQYGSLSRWHPARRLHRSPRLSRLSQKLWPWPSRLLGDVLQCPVFCFHAVTITRQGCLRLLNFLTSQPTGIFIPDCMIHDAMAGLPSFPPFPLSWYAWNAGRLASNVDERGRNPHWIKRNFGLVLQEEAFSTDIQPRLGTA
ncbi:MULTISPECIES: glycosyltransferase family 25 protein [unclassified Cyanobium]|uniref:glycosyltransferase family 25 protein n=1 Tax=unclassified Cyanobium TaxID=2627006 RepID=UPI0020CE596E|nr:MULTISPECIES: glycosyltransferase family 25 protein [unclassified Cyanobium]MCP9835791.1 glycosyltransferase family 25 protein [Cyanobium sp. La Preciosa 7G6]MCP9938557.1 glycosyltransferase family 25 protein [Cyanobium sp. Aljojuca 7A6]